MDAPVIEKVGQTTIDHVAIKVSNLSEMCDAFEKMGMACHGIERYEEVGMQIAFLSNGDAKVELLEVTRQDSPIATAKPGFHHLGLKVNGIEDIYLQMKESPKYKVLGQIRQGAHQRKIFFFEIVGQEDTLFECVE